MGSFDHTKPSPPKNELSPFPPNTPSGEYPVNWYTKTNYKFATETDFAPKSYGKNQTMGGKSGVRYRKTKFVVLDDGGPGPKGSKIRRVVGQDRDRSDGRGGSNISVEIPTSKVWGPNDGLFRRNDSSTVRGVQAFRRQEWRGPGLLEKINRNPYKVADGTKVSKNRIKHLMAENSKIKNVFRTIGSKLG